VRTTGRLLNDEHRFAFAPDVESRRFSRPDGVHEGPFVPSMKPLGDRRAQIRYDVVGMLFARLDSGTSVRILNVSTIGALLSTSQPIPVGVTHSILFTLLGQQFAVGVIPRRIEQIEGGGQREYHVGVEFVSVPGGLSDSLLSFGLGR
jgi:hypothetical protein